MLLSGLALALVLGLSPRATAQDDAKEIVKKAIEAHGGAEKLDKLKASKTAAKGTISIMGMDLDFTVDTASQLPDRRKTIIKLEVMGMAVTIEQVSKGENIKMTMNGMELPIPENQKADIKTEVAMMKIQRLTPLLSDKSFELKSIGESDVNGKKADGITVTGKDVKEIKLYFDKGSHLLTKVEFMGSDPTGGGGEVKREIVVSDYKDIQGIKVPMKSVMTTDGKKFMESTVTEQKLLEKLDDKDLSD
jgi:hypothetical protein